MKILLQLEDAAKFIGAYIVTLQLGFEWWTFWLWLLAPDVSMLAYAVNTRTGAWVYNLFHHQGLAVLIALAGLYLQHPALQFAGVLLFGHSALDNFKHTHLGWIGKAAEG